VLKLFAEPEPEPIFEIKQETPTVVDLLYDETKVTVPPQPIEVREQTPTERCYPL
jgi:hypothetical protein